ncbi:MAG TPA: hypothetical protein VKP60_05125 [Magnetospirillaceae bacterium]|nr:hypothetical protein [Magnetospirillaceae bacterium]
MATAPKDIASSVTPDLASLQADVTALKKDVASLLDHLQKETVNGARGAVDRLEKQAEQLYRTVYAKGEQQAEVLSHKIEDQPLTAVLIAAGIGYLGGRLLAR